MSEPAAAKPQQHIIIRLVKAIFMLGLCLFVACVLMFALVKPPSAKAGATVAAAPIAAIEWKEIDAIYNLNSKSTDLQKENAWPKYQNKRVQWIGHVAEVSDGIGGLTLHVKMNRRTFTSDILVDLRDDQKAFASNLDVGDKVSFAGTLHSWGTILPITMKDGEVLEAWGPK